MHNAIFNSLTYNFDMQQLMHTVVCDCIDAQQADSNVPHLQRLHSHTGLRDKDNTNSSL